MGARRHPCVPSSRPSVVREDIDARLAHAQQDRRSLCRDRPSSDRRKFPGEGPGHQLVLIALGHISTPRNQQHKGAKEHKSNDGMKTREPGNALAKGEMDR